MHLYKGSHAGLLSNCRASYVLPQMKISQLSHSWPRFPSQHQLILASFFIMDHYQRHREVLSSAVTTHKPSLSFSIEIFWPLHGLESYTKLNEDTTAPNLKIQLPLDERTCSSYMSSLALIPPERGIDHSW